MSAHALLVMNNLRVEAFFESIREVFDGSGYTDDTGVDDHIAIVDGDSASGDADLGSVDNTNIRKKYDRDYEVVPFNAAYDGSLSKRRQVFRWRIQLPRVGSAGNAIYYRDKSLCSRVREAINTDT